VDVVALVIGEEVNCPAAGIKDDFIINEKTESNSRRDNVNRPLFMLMLNINSSYFYIIEIYWRLMMRHMKVFMLF
jgi:hypothetical protein